MQRPNRRAAQTGIDRLHHAGFGAYDDLMAKLGKHKTGRSCLYIKKLEGVDLDVLEKLVVESVAWMRETYNA